MRLCRGYLKGGVEVIEEEQRVSEQARPDLYNPSHVIQSLIDYAWRGAVWRGVANCRALALCSPLSLASVDQVGQPTACAGGGTAHKRQIK